MKQWLYCMKSQLTLQKGHPRRISHHPRTPTACGFDPLRHILRIPAGRWPAIAIYDLRFAIYGAGMVRQEVVDKFAAKGRRWNKSLFGELLMPALCLYVRRRPFLTIDS